MQTSAPLIDQTKRGDFKHSKDKMTDIETIEELSVLRVEPLNKFGTQTEIINYFEGKLNTYKKPFHRR